MASRDQGQTANKTLVEWLMELKEIIAFFAVSTAAVIGVFTYFATKSQLEETRCLMNANDVYIKSRIEYDKLSRLLVDNIQMSAELSQKGSQTATDAVKLGQLKIAAEQIAVTMEGADKDAAAALKKLTAGECSPT